jgi:hypothetical protein
MSKLGRKELAEMHAILGTADDVATYQMLSGNFGGAGNSRAEVLNKSLFKANGVAWFTQSTRNMAILAAEKFLIKHATKPGAHSQRYLDELGVSQTDILAFADKGKLGLMHRKEAVATLSKEAFEAHERVRRAMVRFADQAILRPNPQQTPQYYSDPFLAPFTQYRGFLYAIQEQIIGRLAREMNNGNFGVIFGALAYMPIMLASELVRELIQWGTDGNPNRADWGAYEYAKHATMRTGLMGLKADAVAGLSRDIEYNSVPGMSLTGPIVNHAASIGDTAVNNGDWWGVAEEAMPLSSAWKHWNG